MSKKKMIDYNWLRDELKEATYHLTAPLAYMHGSCAKMVFTYMDYLVGEIKYEEMSKIVRECQELNK
jgi:hypothetical protein